MQDHKKMFHAFTAKLNSLGCNEIKAEELFWDSKLAEWVKNDVLHNFSMSPLDLEQSLLEMPGSDFGTAHDVSSEITVSRSTQLPLHHHKKRVGVP